MKIGIRLIKEKELSAASFETEYIEDAEYVFRDDKPKSAEVFIFTKNPIDKDRKIIRGRSIIEYKNSMDDIQIIEDDNKKYNYIYLLPGMWLFDTHNCVIEYDNGDLDKIRDYLSKYDS